VKPLDEPDAERVPFLVTPADERGARFSPDGRWLAYVSDETGDYQVFVRPFPGTGGRWQISTGGGVNPIWSPDGRRIHYRVNREWWIVDVDPGTGPDGSFRTGVPRQVRNDLPRVQLASRNDTSPDGKALLHDLPVDSRGAPSELTVVVDWLAELERRAAR